MPPQPQIPTLPEPKTQLMLSAPGIFRDGTKLADAGYIDGQWVRFYKGKPRKMLGYREQIRTMNGIARQLSLYCENGFSFVHAGSTQALERYSIEILSGSTTGIVDRTPAGYAPDALNLWQLSPMYNTAGNATQIFGVATPSLADISSTTPGQVCGGDITGVAPLTPLTDTGAGATGPIMASGGIAAVAGTYLFTYGASGLITWNVAGSPTNRSDAGSGAARPCASKVVRGMDLRGSSAPAAIFWSLDTVIIGQFVGTPTFWNFTNVTSNGSLLSANGIVEHNGVYYWATTNGFSMFNGVVRDVPNEYNKQFFLDNLNYSQRQKVFAVKVPRWNEIWWYFPRGNSTECNHAVVYDYAHNLWYDTPAPNSGRAAGYSDLIFNYPILSGVDLNFDTEGYSIWQHEIGFDEVSGPRSAAKAIRSFFETNQMSFAVPAAPGQPGDNRGTSWMYLEPDFDQVGDLLFTINTQANARAKVISPVKNLVIPAEVANNTEIAKFKATGRLTSFRIESNVTGGNYVAGAPVIHYGPSDARMQD